MHCCRIVNGIKNKNIKNSLGAMWNASHLAVRLCALRHWKRVSMPPTTQSLRHPLTRAIHFAVFYVFVSVPQYFSTEPKAADNHMITGCPSYPRRESNPDLRFRKPSFYPLNYGGIA